MLSPYTPKELAAHKAYRGAVDALLTELINFSDELNYWSAVDALVRLRKCYNIGNQITASCIIIDLMLEAVDEPDSQAMLADVWRQLTAGLLGDKLA